MRTCPFHSTTEIIFYTKEWEECTLVDALPLGAILVLEMDVHYCKRGCGDLSLNFNLKYTKKFITPKMGGEL